MKCYKIAVVAAKIILVESMENGVLSTDGVDVFGGGVGDVYFFLPTRVPKYMRTSSPHCLGLSGGEMLLSSPLSSARLGIGKDYGSLPGGGERRVRLAS